MNEMVCLNQVTKTYQSGDVEVTVVKGIDLLIQRGEFLSIMGPSGSGKSTLLYMIGGLDKPSSGSILVNGKDISRVRDKEESLMRRREIGFIFQAYNLVPNLNVEENVVLPVLLDGRKQKDYKHKVEELLELVGLSDRRKHKPRELSGGQQQRVAIARALVHDPQLILADEPTGNLDSQSSTGVLELFKHIHKEKGTTIVQVTHSFEAAQYADRIIHMKDGIVE